MKQERIPAVHVLHAHNHVTGIMEECSVERYNIWRGTVMHDVELSNNLLPYVFLGLYVDDLTDCFSPHSLPRLEHLTLPFWP